jgi:hypothetical protein
LLNALAISFALSAPALAQPRVLGCGSPGSFFPVAPCRAVDTRNAAGALGGPALNAGTTRSFPIGGTCGIPASVAAISLNVTTEGATAAGALRLFPAGITLPMATGISYSAQQTRANNGIIALGAGALAIYCDQASGTTNVIVDVNGYFE